MSDPLFASKLDCVGGVLPLAHTFPTNAGSDAPLKPAGTRLKALWLVRHGETEWSVSGQHTGRTDLPLTAAGERKAQEIGTLLRGRHFDLVLTSPLKRAVDTCRLAGYAQNAITDANLLEWDYGEYEGRRTPDIQKDRPGWNLWTDGVAGGESIAQVADRARAVIDRALGCPGEAIVFAHGHILRILASCWLGLPAQDGRLLALDTASVGTLGYERDTRVIARWNSFLSE